MVSWKKATEFTELFGPAAPQTPRQTPQPLQPPPAPAPVQIQEPPASAPPTPPPLPKEFQLHAERKVHSAKKPKGELPQKMSSRYFWSWLTLSMGLFFGFLALLFLAIFNERLSRACPLHSGTWSGSYALHSARSFWRSCFCTRSGAIPAELQRVPPASRSVFVRASMAVLLALRRTRLRRGEHELRSPTRLPNQRWHSDQLGGRRGNMPPCLSAATRWSCSILFGRSENAESGGPTAPF